MTNETPTPQQSFEDRLLAAAPLLFAFLVVSSLYVWQASKHPTPWLFSDELEYAQISRAIADTGTPARRGVEYWGAGLFPWLIAPFWWFDNLQTAYSAVKTFNVLMMTAAIFPTYGLARMLMPRPYALIAGVGAVLAPSFIYTAMVMQEPVAYLAVAGSFYLGARALASPTRWSILAAVAVSVVAPFVRDQLIVVPALMIAAIGVQYTCFGKGRARLEAASTSRRIGMAVGAVTVSTLALLIARSGSAEVALAFERPGTMLDQALWAWGALAIGLGIFPVVIGLGMLAPTSTLPRTPRLAAFTSVFVASVVLFTAYVAIKGTYQAATFEPRITERNLAYLTPILMIAVALFAATRAIRPWTLAIAAALTAWAISSVPINLAGLEGDAPGVAILSRIKEDYDLSLDGINQLLYALLAVSVLVGLAPALLGRRRRVAAWIVVAAVILSIGWSARAETVAAKYSNDFSALFLDGLPKPLSWVDEATGGKPVVYISQKIADPNDGWSMEFWNRGIREVWSLDGTARGPGPVLTPNLIATDGRLVDGVGYEYAVINNGLSLVGTKVTEHGLLQLIQIDQPLRLKESLGGVFDDGWIGSVGPAETVIADYNRFDASSRPGTVFVTLSRKAFCGPRAPGRVLIEVGTMALGQQKNGVIDKVTSRNGWVVDSCAERTFPIPTPGGPFHVKVSITPPFQPAVLDPRGFERRYLGAQLGIISEP
ncbi:hypothetical protein [Gaiella sp.]|uniref:ArnT family glycosyltransferase n=1 Tax=Gaiella sp. TaxID=2663207 RepID=UPI003267E8F8